MRVRKRERERFAKFELFAPELIDLTNLYEIYVTTEDKMMIFRKSFRVFLRFTKNASMKERN